MNHKTQIVTLVVSIAAARGYIASAGPIDPPPGPVESTYKTLSEVEPRIAVNATNTSGDDDSLFKITQPGSYYLIGNIVGVSDKHGIEIAGGGVTLDLMGFAVVAGVPGSLDGVNLSVAASNIAVLNGSVYNWSGDGVDLGNATNTRLADLRVEGNTGNAILAGSNAVVTGCAAYLNGGVGISTGPIGSITDCSARGNGMGIFAGAGSTITNCSAYQNTTEGIKAESGGTITNCSAYDNTEEGIVAAGGSTITNSTAGSNADDGISVSNDCAVRGNTCHNNGSGGDGAGIHATGSHNRIEGNNCTDNDRGLEVGGAGNFITRNTCAGNTTNWDVAAGNACLVVSAATGASIVGDNGGVSPGSTNPNANFTY